MKLLLVCLFVIAAFGPGSCNVRGLDTFEFGINVGRVSFTASGNMRKYQMFEEVKVIVPECSDLKYVRVDINSHDGPPAVSFNWDTKVVQMQYTWVPRYPTQYNIIGKAIPNGLCGPLKSRSNVFNSI